MTWDHILVPTPSGSLIECLLSIILLRESPHKIQYGKGIYRYKKKPWIWYSVVYFLRSIISKTINSIRGILFGFSFCLRNKVMKKTHYWLRENHLHIGTKPINWRGTKLKKINILPLSLSWRIPIVLLTYSGVHGRVCVCLNSFLENLFTIHIYTKTITTWIIISTVWSIYPCSSW